METDTVCSIAVIVVSGYHKLTLFPKSRLKITITSRYSWDKNTSRIPLDIEERVARLRVYALQCSRRHNHYLALNLQTRVINGIYF